MKTQTKKLMVYLPNDLHCLLKTECERLGVTYSGYVTNMLRTQLDFQKQLIDHLTPEVLEGLVTKMKGGKV